MTRWGVLADIHGNLPALDRALAGFQWRNVDRIAVLGDARLTRDLSSDDIRRGFRRARAWLMANGCRWWLFGHTHRARVWTLDGADGAPGLHFDAAADALPAVIDLGNDDGETVRIVNAGSVGLPFPGKGPASATLIDTVAGVVEIFTV